MLLSSNELGSYSMPSRTNAQNAQSLNNQHLPNSLLRRLLVLVLVVVLISVIFCVVVRSSVHVVLVSEILR